MDPIIIVGAGHAAWTLARELRRLDGERPVMLVTRDAGAAYYKPNLSKALAMGKSADELIQQPAEQAAAAIGIDIRSGIEVTAIDAAAHTIEAGGETLRYAQLVLATGAQPMRLPVLGDALAVNHLDDYRRFRAGLTPGARVLIVGAGLIGCEFANDLASAGHAVNVVDLAGWPLPRLLPEAQGRALQAALEALGVRFHFGCSVTALQPDTATLSNGEQVVFDRLLSAVGLLPDTRLAAAAGLACGRGIRVDHQLRTSDADIYALGDCIDVPSQFGDQPMPYVLPIAHGARALARTLCGEPTPVSLPAMPVMVKTPACPTLVCPPPAVAGQWQVSGDSPDLEAVYVDAQGRELGFALTGKATARRGEYTARMPATLP